MCSLVLLMPLSQDVEVVDTVRVFRLAGDGEEDHGRGHGGLDVAESHREMLAAALIVLLKANLPMCCSVERTVRSIVRAIESILAWQQMCY